MRWMTVVAGVVMMSVAVGVTVVVSVVMGMPDRVLGAVVVVAMAPEQEFLEHEEECDARDQRDAHLVHPGGARAEHRVGNQGQQRRA